MSESVCKVGILGAGSIAAKMASTLCRMEGACAWAVASRSIERAREFASLHQVEKAYGSYREMMEDPDVDLVYIATPHSLHYEHARMCIEYGKPVLCEKAFTANTDEAEKLISLAHGRGVFIAEAIWTRYMPFSKTLRELAFSGIIGHPYMLTASLGYPISDKERIVSPDLCGGALLDLGVYPINFALMMFGENIVRTESVCVKNELGVDMQNAMIFVYEDGRMAVMQTTAFCANDRQAVVSGDRGYMIIDNINNPQLVEIYDCQHVKVSEYRCPEQISGYEYEVEACWKAIRNGLIEPEEMPHEKTLMVMRMLDGLRSKWGVRFPADDPRA